MKPGNLLFIGVAFLGAAVLAAGSAGAWALLSHAMTLPVRSPSDAALGVFVVGGAGLFAGLGALVLAAGGAYHAVVRYRLRGETDG